jgi:transketolase
MSPSLGSDLDQIAVNTIRFLAVDMVEKANSGHPGAPMGQAAMAYVLWTRHLSHNPANPDWPNRDRFILSCGHASALLYALLHLSGYDLSLEEIQRFRQLGSKTPGHPEHHLTPGVETTTGPLGQGISNAVGMAIAERIASARFNRPGFEIVDHRTWVFASDGDLMEGVASETCSLAGHLGLGKLNVFYDDNKISIDGPTSLTFSEDVKKRFRAYGWHVRTVDDANDLEALDHAAEAAKAETSRPTLVIVRTHIGYGSPNKQDTAGVHGSPLGAEEVDLTKKALGWPLEPLFHIPVEAREAFGPIQEEGRKAEAAWTDLLTGYRAEHRELASELERRLAGELPEGWERHLPVFSPDDGPLATRKASGAVLAALAEPVPDLVGGSADLTPSNNTYLPSDGDFSNENPVFRNLRFGVREHGMGSLLNGLALSKLFIPYGGTFLVFSDYMRASIRLAAVMELPVIYVFTHDSIFLGEDGPTHQPISQLLSLRAIPRLTVIRPADANETVAAWAVALRERDHPTALILSRQKIPILPGTADRGRTGVARGGYVLAEAAVGDAVLILLASGSEVSLALEARQRLEEENIPTRVVSLPSWELFEAQNAAYRESVLPSAVRKRLAIEAGVPLGWERYVGDEGEILGIDRFGASAPYRDLEEPYGFTVDQVVRRASALLG